MSASPEVLTFGCRLNIAESEAMKRGAEAAGLRDVVIVNTCAVTAEAERQAGQAIRRVKRENPSIKIVVTGCSSQIDPQKYAAMREVEGIIGNDEKLNPESFRGLVQKATSFRRKPESSASDSEHTNRKAFPIEPPKFLSPQTRLKLDSGFRRNDDTFIGTLSPPKTAAMQRAFIQVQNGCDNRCTFCVIPFGRGASRSVSFEDVTAQAQACVAEEFNEIVLTGVDIASYGRDLPGQPTLGYMVRRVLAETPTLPRLRLSSIDPAAFDEDLWELIEQEPRLMPHIHLSLQAGDDIILKRMKRRHARDDISRLVERARKARPDIVFGADIIAGFPTETEAMFANTADLIERCDLTWLHVFPYSSRKETPASKMPQIHGSVRKERADRLRALGTKAAQRHFNSLVGSTVKILVENNGIGCTPQFAKLKLLGQAPVGQIVDARCVRRENDSVMAEVGANAGTR